MRRAPWLVVLTLTGCLSDAVPLATGDGQSGGDGGDPDGSRVDTILFDSPPVEAIELWSGAAIGDVNLDGLDDLVLSNLDPDHEGLLIYRGGPAFPHLDQSIVTDLVQPLGVTIVDGFGSPNPDLFAIGPEASGPQARLFVVPGSDDGFVVGEASAGQVEALGENRSSPWFVAPMHAFEAGGAEFVYGNANQGTWIGTAESYAADRLPYFTPRATPTGSPLTSPQTALVLPDESRLAYSAMVVPANFDLCVFTNGSEGAILTDVTCRPTGAASQLSNGQQLDGEGDGDRELIATSALDVVLLGWSGDTLLDGDIYRGVLANPSARGHDYALLGQLGGLVQLDSVAVKLASPDTFLTVERDWTRVGTALESASNSFITVLDFEARVAVIGKFSDRGPELWLFDARANTRCYVLVGSELEVCP